MSTLVHKKFCTEVIEPCDLMLGEGSCDTVVNECVFCSNDPYTGTVVAAYGLTGAILLIALVGARLRVVRMKKKIKQQITIEAAQ